MLKTIRVSISIILLLWVVTSCQSEQVALPRLRVIGDLQHWVAIHEQWDTLDRDKIVYGDETIDAINVHDMIQTLDVIYDQFDLVLKADDGFMIRLDGETLEDTYIGFSKSNHWVFISDKHPVNSRIKYMRDMIIVKKEVEPSNHEWGLNIIDHEETLHLSMGQLLCQEFRIHPYHEGNSSLETDGDTVTISVMAHKQLMKLTDLIDEDISSLLIMDEDGRHIYELDGDGYIEIGENHVNYMKRDGSLYYNHIQGVIINPPEHSIMDTYYDALHFIENNDKVLILFLDGFSYGQYRYIKENKPHLYLSRMEGVSVATSVYKPVTNAGFAAMITGKSPYENGVLNRNYREYKVDSIFDRAEELGKRHVLIEANTAILRNNTTLILNNDDNLNGSIDDEIYQSALETLDGEADLALVHFHSIDEVGHRYGQLHEKVIAQIEVVDAYVKSMVSMWDGKVILVSDHGMHDTHVGGSHGAFRAEDILVPYVVLDGGR